MPQFKSINFSYNEPKIKLFLHKNCKISERWGLRSQTPLPPVVGGVALKPPMASCARDCSYLIDNSFVVIFYCLFDVLSTLALVKCLIVWQYFCNVGGNDCAYSIESAPWKSCPLALLTFRHPWLYSLGYLCRLSYWVSPVPVLLSAILILCKNISVCFLISRRLFVYGNLKLIKNL